MRACPSSDGMARCNSLDPLHLRQGLNLTVGTTGLAACPDVRPVRNNGQLVGAETPTSLA